ncbi:unnamed protein product [Hermetia illucens]|uniref:Uncharacterized protein n=1 Tax=Hermetia illucens TaxID=343691 RepID=A0A7R8YRG6_HERIL|nr:uncharacterized protein LOC119649538 [Hermetia illucens]CAD7082683.1 unnamed protein product [Hermetia illucens]
MFKFVITFAVLAVAVASAAEYFAAPALQARYAAPYIAPLQSAPLALATPLAAPLASPLVYTKLALPAAAGYSQYSSIATPNSYSEQYKAEQKPLAYSSIIY